ATAVAMFAHGTESCAPANMVTGPGNIWVAAANRSLGGSHSPGPRSGPGAPNRARSSASGSSSRNPAPPSSIPAISAERGSIVFS
ncbi:histidinol dehydrogenase, partial [Streptomyces tendae]